MFLNDGHIAYKAHVGAGIQLKGHRRSNKVIQGQDHCTIAHYCTKVDYCSPTQVSILSPHFLVHKPYVKYKKKYKKFALKILRLPQQFQQTIK